MTSPSCARNSLLFYVVHLAEPTSRVNTIYCSCPFIQCIIKIQAKTSKVSIKDPLNVIEFLSAFVVQAAQSRMFLTLSGALSKL